MEKLGNLALMIVQIGLLYLFYLVGAWIQALFGLVIPGSVIGLVLLFLCLFFNIIPEKWIASGASFMVKHLIIFFIPATAGIINYYELFIGKGIIIVIITVISSLFVLVTSGFVSEKLVAGKDSHHG